MNLNVYATEAPMFSVQSGFVNLTVQAAVKAAAIESNGSNVPLFTLKAVSTLF